jgi:hypothetical protein
MTIGVLALVGLAPERVAALTAAGYAVREGKKSANRIDQRPWGLERRRDGLASESRDRVHRQRRL